MTAIHHKTKQLILSCYKPPYDAAVVDMDCEHTPEGAVVFKAKCSVQEDHYIMPTGHLNAVTWQIVLNQIAYLSFGYLCQKGQLKNAGKTLTVEDFIALRDHSLIRRSQMEFMRQISPQAFVTEGRLHRMRGSAFWKMQAYVKSADDQIAAEAGIVLTLDPQYRG